MTKQQVFVETFRQWVRDYKEVMKRAWNLQNDWALYQTILNETDVATDVLPSATDGTRLTSVTDAMANLSTIFSSFDAGIDDNFERVS